MVLKVHDIYKGPFTLKVLENIDSKTAPLLNSG